VWPACREIGKILSYSLAYIVDNEIMRHADGVGEAADVRRAMAFYDKAVEAQQHGTIMSIGIEVRAQGS
jgi:hypothetical protein